MVGIRGYPPLPYLGLHPNPAKTNIAEEPLRPVGRASPPRGILALQVARIFAGNPAVPFAEVKILGQYKLSIDHKLRAIFQHKGYSIAYGQFRACWDI